jgi:hypothetical protein
MKIFIDTEFTDLVLDMDLISIGLAAQDGAEFYGERNDFDRAKCSDFVVEIVLPQLGESPERVMSRNQLRDEVRAWLAQYEHLQPCICFDFMGDWMLLWELLDGDVPAWLTYQNVYRNIDPSETDRFWRETELKEHHALNDARANLCAYRVGLGT